VGSLLQYEPLTINKINSITTEYYPAPAKRPAYTVMDCKKIKQDFGVEQANWKDELKEVVKELCSQ